MAPESVLKIERIAELKNIRRIEKKPKLETDTRNFQDDVRHFYAY